MSVKLFGDRSAAEDEDEDEDDEEDDDDDDDEDEDEDANQTHTDPTKPSPAQPSPASQPTMEGDFSDFFRYLKNMKNSCPQRRYAQNPSRQHPAKRPI